ncbi:MAG: hypothetical protein QOK44_3404 [Betaproteobacteria bacterium]|jgi:hypothetical protein|nr:hypothetical protein [Betaproteobacteria bacterium]
MKRHWTTEDMSSQKDRRVIVTPEQICSYPLGSCESERYRGGPFR